MILIAQTILYMLAVAGIVAGSLGMIFFVGGAMNKARPPEMRQRRWLLAALCVAGVIVSTAIGFMGIPGLLYLAQR